MQKTNQRLNPDLTPEDFLWWQTGVVYQIYPRSYKDTTGSGIGDLRGVITKLDYLSDTLGIDAIWLSPFYPSPMKDFGYDVADYRDVDPMFGTLDDFDDLLHQAHHREIRIIIDLVPNHSSDQHAWFQESRSSRDNPKRDWYVWADPKEDGSPPNNWLSVFGGPAWEWDEATGQYYLHSFLKEQPDLNWRNPDVREAMFDVVRFWLERGVDGFRVDVAHYILKDPEMRDNPVPETPAKSIHRPLGEYDSQFHLYDKGHPDVHEAYRQFREVLDAYSQERPRVAIGEIHIPDWDVWASYYGENLDELHMPFNFSLLGADWNAAAVREIVDQLEAVLQPGAWPNYVLGNHDEHRLASRVGEDQTRVAAMLLLTLRGTPTIYYGEEIGMTNVDIPRERQQDPAGLRQPGQERDLCRTPMQWSDEPHAGFAPPETEQLWLPLGENWREVNVAAQLDDPNSLLSLYRRLLAVRKENPALQVGRYQPVDDVPAACFVYRRRGAGQSLMVALNFTGDSQLVPLQQEGTILLSTHLDREGEGLQNELELRPNEGVIIIV
jgi:glycosidase